MSIELDTTPWFRQFWPWFLIALPAAAVIASVYTLFLAMNTSDSLVSASNDGMDVIAERHIAAERRAATLGLNVQLQIDIASGAIKATLASSQAATAVWPTTLTLEFAHPAFARQDLQVTLTAAIPDASGAPVWSGHVAALPSGRWYLVLRSGDEWRLSSTWSGEAILILRPVSGDEHR